ENFLGGAMKLDSAGAAGGIAEKIAKPLKMDTVAAAQAIIEIAISKMSLAVREVSVAKGYDPRDFALVASGGAGPLHVIAIARELHIPTVIVPLFPSHFSALGMLLADERHHFIRTSYSDLAAVAFAAPVEMVNIRLGIIGKRTKLRFPPLGKTRAAMAVSHHREVYFSDAKRVVHCPVYQRDALMAGTRIVGPAIVQELGTTTVLFKGD